MPADHFSTAQKFLTMAAKDQAALRDAKQRQDLEIHSLKRQLERSADRMAKMDREISRLEVEVDRLKGGIATARRATLEHVGRTA